MTDEAGPGQVLPDGEQAEHPDLRVAGRVICGLITSTGRYEWVCIREPHAKISDARRSSQPNQLGHHPQHERHHFVRRYPNRDDV